MAHRQWVASPLDNMFGMNIRSIECCRETPLNTRTGVDLNSFILQPIPSISLLQGEKKEHLEINVMREMYDAMDRLRMSACLYTCTYYHSVWQMSHMKLFPRSCFSTHMQHYKARNGSRAIDQDLSALAVATKKVNNYVKSTHRGNDIK